METSDQAPAQRLDYPAAAPGVFAAMQGLEKYLGECGLDGSLRELVKLRASQINGCAFCVDLHTRVALKMGESERRLHAVAVWEESPLFTPRERAALAWTEAVTRIGDGHAPGHVYAFASRHFQGKELVDLTLAVVAINGWNRLAIAFRTAPPIADR